MFDEEFYPTPEPVIRKMLQPHLATISNANYGNYTILEPSAGSGALIDYVMNYCTRKPNVYAIEADPNLAEMIKGKGYKLLHNDFLSYTGSYFFDLIMMNPPFSNGDEHLLKAWDVLQEGHIVCLLNDQTIKNPYTQKRKLLVNIIKEFGSVEYLGSVFSNSDRKTDVGVALVRLQKKATAKAFDFSAASKTKVDDKDFSEENLSNGIARVNMIDTLIHCYGGAREALFELIKAHHKLISFMGPLGLQDYSVNLKEMIQDGTSVRPEMQYNKRVGDLNKAAWGNLIYKSKMESLFTSQLKKDFSKFTEQQGAMDFTKENISALFDMLFANKGAILERCILDTFERLCSYDAKNKVHWEGWKTNDAYKVNMKVIVPWGIRSWGQDEAWYLRYDKAEKFNDIDKALCYLTGERLEGIRTIAKTIDDDLQDKENRYSGKEIESHFFHIRYFKKGTVHLKFKDAKLWERFNVAAAKGKNWLPA
jgi:predicted RNA methylase